MESVAKRLGNTPSVCRKAYVHPAVRSLGARLAKDVGAMNEIWKEIAGQPKSLNRLHAAEARLIAFLKQHRLRSKRTQKQFKIQRVKGPTQKLIAQRQKAQP